MGLYVTKLATQDRSVIHSTEWIHAARKSREQGTQSPYFVDPGYPSTRQLIQVMITEISACPGMGNIDQMASDHHPQRPAPSKKYPYNRNGNTNQTSLLHGVLPLVGSRCGPPAPLYSSIDNERMLMLALNARLDLPVGICVRLGLAVEMNGRTIPVGL